MRQIYYYIYFFLLLFVTCESCLGLLNKEKLCQLLLKLDFFFLLETLVPLDIKTCETTMKGKKVKLKIWFLTFDPYFYRICWPNSRSLISSPPGVVSKI